MILTAYIAGVRISARIPEGRELSVISALDAPPVTATLGEVRRWHVERVARLCNGHQQEMARILGISDRTLRKWRAADRESAEEGWDVFARKQAEVT